MEIRVPVCYIVSLLAIVLSKFNLSWASRVPTLSTSLNSSSLVSNSSFMSQYPSTMEKSSSIAQPNPLSTIASPTILNSSHFVPATLSFSTPLLTHNDSQVLLSTPNQFTSQLTPTSVISGLPTSIQVTSSASLVTIATSLVTTFASDVSTSSQEQRVNEASTVFFRPNASSQVISIASSPLKVSSQEQPRVISSSLVSTSNNVSSTKFTPHLSSAAGQVSFVTPSTMLSSVVISSSSSLKLVSSPPSFSSVTFFPIPTSVATGFFASSTIMSIPSSEPVVSSYSMMKPTTPFTVFPSLSSTVLSIDLSRSSVGGQTSSKIQFKATSKVHQASSPSSVALSTVAPSTEAPSTVAPSTSAGYSSVKPSTPTEAHAAKETSRSLIIGLAVGLSLGLVLVIVIIILYRRRRASYQYNVFYDEQNIVMHPFDYSK